MKPKYKRILLKLSGEALSGNKDMGYDFNSINTYCTPIKACVDAGIQVAIVVGGGNLWRGRSSGKMDRTRADHMGMLATTMNALAIADNLEQLGCKVKVMNAIQMNPVTETFVKNNAIEHLENGNVVVFAGGTGNPYFSTDSAAALRAIEINADIIFKATMVDGIYDSDPKKNPNAKKFDFITFKDVLEKDLKVMDSTAAALCKDNEMPLLVFNLTNPENIVFAASGKTVGTIVSN